MNLASLFKGNRVVYSLEVFPPKKTSPVETIYNTLDELEGLKPDFISVTYGAGGSTSGTITCDIAVAIKNRYHIEPLVHLTCINDTKQEVERVLRLLKENGIKNILALRGDRNPDITPKSDFKYASDLVAFIKEFGGFSISGACYPEGHTEAKSLEEDINNLKLKVDAGVEHLITQLFFDNSLFYSFMEKVRAKGITVPVEAGIMPVTNKAQIERMVTLCGASLPSKFTKMMQRFEHSPAALQDAGIAYAIDQIVDLISRGVDGIHLYTMNKPYVARKITENIAGLLNV
jgi:methylenetetrahydrofolate reductase (NADPH)